MRFISIVMVAAMAVFSQDRTPSYRPPEPTKQEGLEAPSALEAASKASTAAQQAAIDSLNAWRRAESESRKAMLEEVKAMRVAQESMATSQRVGLVFEIAVYTIGVIWWTVYLWD